ncbi:MAG: Polyphosphate kinase [Synergistetes bacterium ADurb.Bin520]|nr:MAG: Polyphosphate kinase [Synergistetes bacterium ADurb.Bin520]
MGLFTADEDIGEDVASLFNVITGYARQKDYRKLLVAPGALRGEMRRRIDREIERHRRYGDGYLAFKMNALVDPECIDALYRASQAGVPIDLQVRGTCCLRPGVPGLSETITVTSIVGRFLEHVRMYYFRAGGGEDEELFLGSADLMERNLDRRVEVLFPIQDPVLRRVLCDEVLQVHLKDTARARLLQPDGSYVPRHPREGEPGVHAQRRMVENRGIWHIPAPGDEI